MGDLGTTYLVLACKYAYVLTVQNLIDKEADVAKRENANPYSKTPLYAVFCSGIDIVEKAKLILRNSKNPEKLMNNEIHKACVEKAIHLVKLLVEPGANLQRVDKNGKSGIDLAMKSNIDSLQKVKFLWKEMLIKSEVTESTTLSPIHSAVLTSDIAALQALLQSTYTKPYNLRKTTPLHEACAKELLDFDCIRTLLHHFTTDINAQNEKGETPIAVLVNRKKMDGVKLFLADPRCALDLVNSNEKTVLQEVEHPSDIHSFIIDSIDNRLVRLRMYMEHIEELHKCTEALKWPAVVADDRIKIKEVLSVVQNEVARFEQSALIETYDPSAESVDDTFRQLKSSLLELQKQLFDFPMLIAQHSNRMYIKRRGSQVNFTLITVIM